jgi:cellulose 1,4-beta-cellobiosidase
VTATPGDSQATVSWTAPAFTGNAPLDSYIVTTSDGVNPPTTTTVPATQTSATITGLTNGTPYSFTVTAHNSVGEGGQSNSRSATPSAGGGGGVPGAAQLSASGLGGFTHGIGLTWTAAAANGSTVTNYRIYRATSSGGTFTLIATVGAVLAYTDTGNPSFAISYYRVVAVNAAGPGPNSNTASAFSW